MGNIGGLPNPVGCTCLTEEISTQGKKVASDKELPLHQRKEKVIYSGIGESNLVLVEPFINESTFTQLDSTNRFFSSNKRIKQAESELFKDLQPAYSSQASLLFSQPITLDSFSSTLMTPNVWKSTPSITQSLTTASNCTCFPIASDSWEIHRDITSITSVVVSSIIIIANWFVLGSIVWSLWQKHKRRNVASINRSYIFIFNLALADLLVGIANVINFSLNLTIVEASSYENCLVEVCFIITPCCASITTMTVVGVDRYLTVMHPFKYKSLITVKKAVLIIALVWIASSLLGFAPLMGWGEMSEDYYKGGKVCSYLFVVGTSYVLFTLFGAFLPQLVIIVYLYAQIFKVSRKHNKQISQMQQASKVQLPRPQKNGYGTFPKEGFVDPHYSRSCPVTPLMPRIEINLENGNNVSKTQQPPRRKPFRTVSFGPASFGDNPGVRSSDSSNNSSSNFGSGLIRRPRSSTQDQDDNVFENSLSLPGAVFSQKHLPEVNSSHDEIISIPILQKGQKPRNAQKLKRTVSYAGSVALTSLASQISNRFGNLKKEVAKRNIKALRTVAVVIGFFFFMWSPFLLISVIQVLCGSGCQLRNLVGTYLLLLGITNSAINPLVYTYTNKELKNHVARICCKKKRPNIITNHNPIGSESFLNTSMGHSADAQRDIPTWVGYRRYTQGSLGSSLYETTRSRGSGRSSIESGRYLSTNSRNRPKSNSSTRRRSDSFCYVKRDSVIKTNYLPLPPSGRKKSIVILGDDIANTLKVSTGFMI